MRLSIGASLLCGLVPAGFAVWSVRDWASRGRELTMVERRRDYAQVPWLRPPFPELVTFLDQALQGQQEARVLVEPVIEPGVEATSSLSPPRWHVFLTHYAYPARFYVRAPALSCVGFNHGAWLDHHFEVLDLDGSDSEAAALRDDATAEELDRHGIGWRLRIPVRGASPSLFGLDRRVGGEWVPVPLPEQRP